MKYTRKRMLDSFEQLEIELESNLGNMGMYYAMTDEELTNHHKEIFDGMYEEDYNYGYEYNSNGEKVYL